MSFRKFIRSLKLLSTPAEIAVKLSTDFPQHAHIKTPARQLEAITVNAIAITPRGNIIEMLKVVNNILPKIAGDAIQQQIYLSIRNAIKKRFVDDPIIPKAYKIMRFDQTKFRANRAAYVAKVYEANANKQEISLQKIIEVMNLIKDSTNISDMAIGLQLACGARVSEILSYSNFDEAKQPVYIIQTGILKQKTDSPRTEIIKPVLHYTRDHFFEMFTHLRSKLSDQLEKISAGTMTHAELSEKYNAKINSRVRSLFNTSDVTSHTLRKIYGNFSYELFANRNRVSEASWLSDVLGHDRHSLSTSTSYSTVSIVDETIDRTFIPRNSKARDGYTMSRLLKTVEAMRNNFKPISARSLKSYGYGSKVVDEYMKSLSVPELS